MNYRQSACGIQIHHNEQNVALSKMMRVGNGKQLIILVWPNMTTTLNRLVFFLSLPLRILQKVGSYLCALQLGQEGFLLINTLKINDKAANIVIKAQKQQSLVPIAGVSTVGR